MCLLELCSKCRFQFLQWQTFQWLALLRERSALDETSFSLGFEVLIVVAVKSSTFCDIMHVVLRKSTDVSEEHVASIFRVEE
jgi:hypothetical protein